MNDSNIYIYWLSFERLTLRQWLNIKDPIVNANNRLNRIFPSFNLFSSEFSPEDRLIDVFPSYFSFHSMNRKSKESVKAYIYKLDEITFQVSVDSKSVVVVLDASIKNQVTISIAHVYTHNSPVIKTIH